MAKYFNKNLKHIRQKKGLSQQALAEKIGTDRSTISRWENGEIDTPLEMAMNIAEILNVPYYDFFGKDLRFDESKFNSSTFEYTDEETGLTVKLIPTNDVNWDSLSDTEKEDYINAPI